MRRIPPGLLVQLMDLLRELSRAFDGYRPERHYMRGPGPKWHAKHDPAATAAQAPPGLRIGIGRLRWLITAPHPRVALRPSKPRVTPD